MDYNREPRNKPSHIWSNDFQQDAKTTQWGKNNFFNKWSWENWVSSYKRTKLDPYLAPYTKINLKMYQRPKTIKFLQENRRKSFMTLDLAMVSWI